MKHSPTHFNLYHRITDPLSAQVRHAIVTRQLDENARFRNVDTGPEALADLIRLTGQDQVPLIETQDGRLFANQSDIFGFLTALELEISAQNRK